MNNELEEILQFYEEERLNLESIIDSHVKAGEYKKAHIHQKVLKKTNTLLSLLNTFKNPHYPKIEQLRNQIAHFSSLPAEFNHPMHKDFFDREIKKMEVNIDFWSKQPIPENIDGQEFDDLIFKLAEDKIKGFHFFLNLETYLYLAFHKADQIIIITIPKYKKLKKNYVLRKSNVKALTTIGFEFDETGKSLVYHYDTSNFIDSIPIKTITSRVIYEGFGYDNLKNSSLIKIID